MDPYLPDLNMNLICYLVKIQDNLFKLKNSAFMNSANGRIGEMSIIGLV